MKELLGFVGFSLLCIAAGQLLQEKEQRHTRKPQPKGLRTNINPGNMVDVDLIYDAKNDIWRVQNK